MLSKEENEARLFNGKGQGKGINFDKYDNIPVQATGRECPECFDTFEEVIFHLLLRMLAWLRSQCALQLAAAQDQALA